MNLTLKAILLMAVSFLVSISVKADMTLMDINDLTQTAYRFDPYTLNCSSHNYQPSTCYSSKLYVTDAKLGTNYSSRGCFAFFTVVGGAVRVEDGCRASFILSGFKKYKARCESKNYNYKECSIPLDYDASHVGGEAKIKMTKQHSNTKCIKGVNYDVVYNGGYSAKIWVTDGCDANFEIW